MKETQIENLTEETQMKKKAKKPRDIDLGSGSVGKLMMKLALPGIVAQVVNLLYNLVDRMYIGRIPEIGETALTGLGICFPIITIVTAFASLVGAGGAPRASIAMGKGNNDGAERILGNSTALVIAISAVLTTILEIFAEPLLVLFAASPETLPYALSYMRIYVAGSFFVMVSLSLNNFISAQGFASMSMATVVIGAVVNIILDPIFIFVFDLGVKGAAIATIIAQCSSAIWVLLFLVGRKSVIKIRMKNIRLQRKILVPIVALGVSPFIMSATESLLNIAFNRSLLKYGGNVAVGAMTILGSVMQLIMMPVNGLTQGAMPIISYNYGARKLDRVKKAYHLLFIIALIYTVSFTSIVLLFPQVFVNLFIKDGSKEMMEMTVWAARIYFVGTTIFGLQIGAQNTFVALGQSKISFFLACLRKVILLIPLIYILPYFFANKLFGVFLAEPIADIIAALTSSTLFALNIKKILSKNAPDVEQ